MALILAAAAMPFAASHRGNFLARQRHRAAIAVGDGGDVNFPAGVRQANERARAEHLGIIRMSQEREGNAALW